MEAIRIDATVGQDGVLRISDLRAGEEVEVIVLRKKPRSEKKRELGWARGWLKILPGFDDPIPGMEDYT